MEKFRSNLSNKVKKYMDINKLTYRECKAEGISGLWNTVSRGSTHLETLFNISQVFDIDVRNFLMFSNKTYLFKNSFSSFEDFYKFLGEKFKKIRKQKGLTAKDLVKRVGNFKSLDAIYGFESGRMLISIKKLCQYIDALGLSPDEFFLVDEEYEKEKHIETEDERKIKFYSRLDEIEQIRGKSVGSQVNINPNKIPTLHILLNICKSLKVHPRDFFDFNKKEFALYRLTDVNIWVDEIKHKMDTKKLKSNRYIELSEIFRFCDQNNISIVDFFEFEPNTGKSYQTRTLGT